MDGWTEDRNGRWSKEYDSMLSGRIERHEGGWRWHLLLRRDPVKDGFEFEIGDSISCYTDTLTGAQQRCENDHRELIAAMRFCVAFYPEDEVTEEAVP